jgi:enamine deaminase RidA (YjgF/YER057c/UK114 family)
MAINKIRIETDNAPPSTGFRSRGMVAGGIFFGAGQIGAEMPEPGVLREPTTDMAEAVQITLGYLEQVTLAADIDRSKVFEVSAFPKVSGKKEIIHQETVDFLGFEPPLFNYHEVLDVAMHAEIEMDWMAVADDALSLEDAAELMRPLGNGPERETISQGPFVMWNRLQGHGDNLGEATDNLLADLQKRLEAEGGSFDHLLKLTVFLYAFDPYPQFNASTQKHFAGIVPPTRSVLVAPEIMGDAKIVIDALALKPA